MKQNDQKNHSKKHSKKYSKKKDKAYFTSKSELLSWINQILKLDIKGIDQTMTGAIFCQLLDAAHPGTVRMNKVNWKAKLETEYISNFKIFQQGLLNNNIEKTININRLSKGKTQELIELLQWLYGHHISLEINPSNYDAQKKRNGQNFIFFGEKIKSINNINNKILRDDLSQCSSNTDLKDSQIKNNLTIKSNINNLNSDLRRDNYQINYNNRNQHRENSVMKNLKNSNSKILQSSNHNTNLSEASSNSPKRKENNTKTNDIVTTPFIIKEQPEENLKENEYEKLNNILFEGISNVDKENILDLEKNDGNDIKELKIILRKTRVNNIIFRNNIGNILKRITKERDFYLNKLKDIEYLYFNKAIKNKNEDKNELLKSILVSTTDSTIIINEQGNASIIENKNNCPISNFPKTEENNDVYMIDKVNSRNKNALKINNNKNSRKEKSKSEISINYAFSRDNKNISEGKYINIKNQ